MPIFFKEENNGYYYCVACSRPTGGFVVTVCSLRSERTAQHCTAQQCMLGIIMANHHAINFNRIQP